MQQSESVPLVRIAEEPTQVVTYYDSMTNSGVAKSSEGALTTTTTSTAAAAVVGEETHLQHHDSSAYDDEEEQNNQQEDHNRPPHRFHYTFDDRTIDLEEVSHYFDLSDDDDDDDAEDKLLAGGGPDLIEMSSPSVVSRLRRIRSQDTACEESIYFDAFHDEIYPREEPPGLRQRLSPLALSILVFYNVSGGPFGMERAVKSGGPFFAILGFLIFPLIWSVPEALVTAELGTAYPEPSGCTS